MSDRARRLDPRTHASRRELTGILEAAVDELPELYRVVFMLREVEQLSTAKTAEVLELTEEAVKVRLHRARAMLREASAARVDERSPRRLSVPRRALRFRIVAARHGQAASAPPRLA